MSGTKIGGQKAAAKNLAKDPFYYTKIGARGGSNGHTGGFAVNPELAREAGRKGGTISRRKSAKVITAEWDTYIKHIEKLPKREGVFSKIARALHLI